MNVLRSMVGAALARRTAAKVERHVVRRAPSCSQLETIIVFETAGLIDLHFFVSGDLYDGETEVLQLLEEAWAVAPGAHYNSMVLPVRLEYTGLELEGGRVVYRRRAA